KKPAMPPFGTLRASRISASGPSRAEISERACSAVPASTVRASVCECMCDHSFGLDGEGRGNLVISYDGDLESRRARGVAKWETEGLGAEDCHMRRDILGVEVACLSDESVHRTQVGKEQGFPDPLAHGLVHGCLRLQFQGNHPQSPVGSDAGDDGPD